VRAGPAEEEIRDERTTRLGVKRRITKKRPPREHERLPVISEEQGNAAEQETDQGQERDGAEQDEEQHDSRDKKNWKEKNLTVMDMKTMTHKCRKKKMIHPCQDMTTSKTLNWNLKTMVTMKYDQCHMM